MNDNEKQALLHAREERLYSSLREQVVGIPDAILSKNPDVYISIPDENSVDFSKDELIALVAKSSNVFATTARYAGIAKALQKIAKARYDRAFKSNKTGNNESEREKNAINSSKIEHLELTFVESIAYLADSAENAARVASESARKILDKVDTIQRAENRVDRAEKDKYQGRLNTY